MIENDDTVICYPERIPNTFSEHIISCINKYNFNVNSNILNELFKGDVFLGIQKKSKKTGEIVFDNTIVYGEIITIIDKFVISLNELINNNELHINWKVYESSTSPTCELGVRISDNNYIEILNFKINKDNSIVSKLLYDELIYPVEINSHIININCSNNNDLEKGLKKFLELSFERCVKNKSNDPFSLLAMWKHKR